MDFSNFAPHPSYQSQCFIVASVMEFVKIWSSRQGASLNFDCQDGAVTIQFKAKFCLGEVKQQPAPGQDNQTRKKPSPSKIRRNRRRAEEYFAKKHQASFAGNQREPGAGDDVVEEEDIPSSLPTEVTAAAVSVDSETSENEVDTDLVETSKSSPAEPDEELCFDNLVSSLVSEIQHEEVNDLDEASDGDEDSSLQDNQDFSCVSGERPAPPQLEPESVESVAGEDTSIKSQFNRERRDFLSKFANVQVRRGTKPVKM